MSMIHLLGDVTSCLVLLLYMVDSRRTGNGSLGGGDWRDWRGVFPDVCVGNYTLLPRSDFHFYQVVPVGNFFPSTLT